MAVLNISIVLYKTNPREIKKCINSIEKCLIKKNIFIIDNSPTNILKKEIDKFSNIKYIHNPSNPGYGAAHNIAIRKTINDKVPYHLVLNSDIYFDEDILNPMIDFLNNSESTGLMMPKILNPDGSIQKLCKLIPSPIDLIKRLFPKFFKSWLGVNEFELRGFKYDKITFIPYLSGCFMLLRTKVLEEIGLFDERFFMYPEDIDLSRRIAEKYETIFFPHCSAFHIYKRSSRKNLKLFLIHSLNMILYFSKWGWVRDKNRIKINKKAIRLIDY